MGDRMSMVLLAVALALSGLLAARVFLNSPDPLVIEAYPVQETIPPPPSVMAPLPPLASLSQTRERPLFAPGRRPDIATADIVESAPAAPAATVSVAPQLELSAVIIEDGRRLALFNRPSGRDALRALQGDTVEGWELSEVRADGVTLSLDGRRHDIALRTFLAPVRGEIPVQPGQPAVNTPQGLVPRPMRPIRRPVQPRPPR